MLPLLKQVLSLDSDLSLVRFGNQNTLLHLAALTCQPKAVKLLLKLEGGIEKKVNIFQ